MGIFPVYHMRFDGHYCKMRAEIDGTNKLTLHFPRYGAKCVVNVGASQSKIVVTVKLPFQVAKVRENEVEVMRWWARYRNERELTYLFNQIADEVAQTCAHRWLSVRSVENTIRPALEKLHKVAYGNA